MTTVETNTSPAWEKIADGVDFLARPDASNDIVALIAFCRLGSVVESRQDAGLVSFTGRMLMRGTKRLTSPQLAETIDSLGISISYDTAEDYSYHHVTTTADALSESVALLSETLFEPSFEPDEIEKERQVTIAAINRSEDDLMSLSLKTFYEELYPNHGYGLPRIGLAESVGELTRAQIVNCHEEIAAAPFRIIAVGNFDPSDLNARLREEFVARRGEATNDIITILPPTPAPPHTKVISRASEQAYLVAGFAGPKPNDPDYMAARLLNCVLGEGMSSRLFQTLREDKGLAYATGSSYSGLKLSGQMFGYIGTKPESLETAREGMLAEFERIKHETVPAEELLRAKNYMIGKFLIDHQRNFKRGFYLGHFDQMGLGIEMDQRYPDLISAVTPEQIQDVAKKILTDPVIVELQP